MSWIVEHLLRNSEFIRSNQEYIPDIVPDYLYDVDNEFGLIIYTLDSDEYNNLLMVERKIKDLYLAGILSDLDLFIIDTVKNNRPLIFEKALPNKYTMSKTFSQICDRIGYFLGGYFTDDGFIYNMQKEYNLTDEQAATLREYMSSSYRHTLRRRIKV